MPANPPIRVAASSPDVAAALRDLLDDYLATSEPGEGESLVTVQPIEDERRGTCIYRIIQASRTVAARYPAASLFLITEDGSRWRLPPPAL